MNQFFRKAMFAVFMSIAACNANDGSEVLGEGPEALSTQQKLKTALGNAQKKVEDVLTEVAEASGTSVDARSFVNGSGNGATFAFGTITGLEGIPATQLPSGVDVAFSYLDLPEDTEQYLPTGFYKVRVTASQETVNQALAATGETPPDTQSPSKRPSVSGAKVELTSSDGSTTVTIPGQIAVWSLSVPPKSPMPRALVEPTTGARYVSVWIICPNGWAVCFKVSWIDYYTYFF